MFDLVGELKIWPDIRTRRKGKKKDSKKRDPKKTFSPYNSRWMIKKGLEIH
ncbi:hypothetical protein HCR_09380 [Hydrogenimonas cancrithermarum]|uniref:Uncharacterized protein n=1 Tax=Hydrogenimonas cancrithermarum TaxID=2993563 RepID=A0ABM8FJY8_9BACT|nr:hypothetical protein HCR_09380 [Hydrogenimonas cancrithermarum]